MPLLKYPGANLPTPGSQDSVEDHPLLDGAEVVILKSNVEDVDNFVPKSRRCNVMHVTSCRQLLLQKPGCPAVPLCAPSSEPV